MFEHIINDVTLFLILDPEITCHGRALYSALADKTAHQDLAKDAPVHR